MLDWIFKSALQNKTFFYFFFLFFFLSFIPYFILSFFLSFFPLLLAFIFNKWLFVLVLKSSSSFRGQGWIYPSYLPQAQNLDRAWVSNQTRIILFISHKINVNNFLSIINIKLVLFLIIYYMKCSYFTAPKHNSWISFFSFQEGSFNCFRGFSFSDSFVNQKKICYCFSFRFFFLFILWVLFSDLFS
jgi:hypothetical protein